MSRKDIFLIIALTFLAFANTLFNDFTGDAYSLFVENHFYENTGNIAKVFTDRLVMTPANLVSGFVTHSADYSGFISYRPVTALSFFFDYYLWKNNPFGYHLTNLLLHIITAVLVYILVLTVSKPRNIAFLAGLLFGIHPIQAEVVNSIGYRSDSLVVLFYLSTLLAYRQFRLARGSHRKTVYRLLSIVCFFLALFSKESALTLPILLVLYDYYFLARTPLGDFFRHRVKIYLIYAIIFISYLFVYFDVMGNVFYSQYRPLAADFGVQSKIIIEIFFHYLKVLFLPWQVSMLPPLYAPSAQDVPFWHIIAVMGFVVISIGWAAGQLKKNRANTFGIIWFFLTFLPTANILTLLNPFAFRFMYLPSIGFFIVAAAGIDGAFNFIKSRSSSLNLEAIAKVALVGIIFSVTIPLNFFFKNNLVACQEMVRAYPKSSRPYWLLGLMEFKRGEYDQALSYLKQYLELPPNLPFIPNPRGDYAVYHLMGRCYVNEPERAIQMFYKVIELNPKFSLVYVDLAKVYILKSDFENALNASLKAIAFENDLIPAYVYAIHSYLALGDAGSAKTWLAKAFSLAPSDRNLIYLKGFIERYESQSP